MNFQHEGWNTLHLYVELGILGFILFSRRVFVAAKSVWAMENTEGDNGLYKDRLRSSFPGNEICNSQVPGRKEDHLSTKLQT